MLVARALSPFGSNARRTQVPNSLRHRRSSVVAALASVNYGPGWLRAATLECPCWIGRVDEARLPIESFCHTTALQVVRLPVTTFLARRGKQRDRKVCPISLSPFEPDPPLKPRGDCVGPRIPLKGEDAARVSVRGNVDGYSRAAYRGTRGCWRHPRTSWCWRDWRRRRRC